MTQDQAELKPCCPQPEITIGSFRFRDGETCEILCLRCCKLVRGHTRPEAVAAWNARPGDAQAEIERLTRERDEAERRLSEVFKQRDKANRELSATFETGEFWKERAKAAEAEAARLRSALADLINDVFGPEREPGEPVPEGLGIYELTTEAYLEREKRYRGALSASPSPVADVVPTNVYYDVEMDNFYDADNKGMGAAFYEKWHRRWRDFPTHMATLSRLDGCAQQEGK